MSNNAEGNTSNNWHTADLKSFGGSMILLVPFQPIIKNCICAAVQHSPKDVPVLIKNGHIHKAMVLPEKQRLQSTYYIARLNTADINLKKYTSIDPDS